jgi:hypothetical protein
MILDHVGYEDTIFLKKEVGEIKILEKIQDFKQILLQKYEKQLPEEQDKPFPETYYKDKVYNYYHLNKIIDKYGLVNTKICKVYPNTTRPVFQGILKQVWIPLQVPQFCGASVNEQFFSLVEGSVYIVNTLLPYYTFNASPQSLLYLSGSMYS